jgi:hypothetical protein
MYALPPRLVRRHHPQKVVNSLLLSRWAKEEGQLLSTVVAHFQSERTKLESSRAQATKHGMEGSHCPCLLDRRFRSLDDFRNGRALMPLRIVSRRVPRTWNSKRNVLSAPALLALVLSRIYHQFVYRFAKFAVTAGNGIIAFHFQLLGPSLQSQRP